MPRARQFWWGGGKADEIRFVLVRIRGFHNSVFSYALMGSPETHPLQLLFSKARHHWPTYRDNCKGARNRRAPEFGTRDNLPENDHVLWAIGHVQVRW